MELKARVRIKVCCIGSVEEAWLAIERGAAALGLVSHMPSGPGIIDEGRIAHIARAIPPGVASVLLTSSQHTGAIIDQQRRLGVNTLQLVDRLTRGSHADLRAALPGVAIVEVIHVTDARAAAEARTAAPHVSALLLDSGDPSLPVKELGGTGRVHDWALSRAIREAVDVPLFLAGGLHAGNVAAAIRQVGPFGVDVCSGVRTGGALDVAKLESFVAAVESAWT